MLLHLSIIILLILIINLQGYLHLLLVCFLTVHVIHVANVMYTLTVQVGYYDYQLSKV